MRVVDDSPDVVQVTSLILQAFGHEVEVATSGRAAIEVARTFKADVAMIDIAMPDMSGLELLDELRGLWGDGPSIIALTGWATRQMRQLALSAGFDYYAVKPIDGRKLNGLIEHVTRKAG